MTPADAVQRNERGEGTDALRFGAAVLTFALLAGCASAPDLYAQEQARYDYTDATTRLMHGLEPEECLTLKWPSLISSCKFVDALLPMCSEPSWMLLPGLCTFDLQAPRIIESPAAVMQIEVLQYEQY